MVKQLYSSRCVYVRIQPRQCSSKVFSPNPISGIYMMTARFFCFFGFFVAWVVGLCATTFDRGAGFDGFKVF